VSRLESELQAATEARDAAEQAASSAAAALKQEQADCAKLDAEHRQRLAEAEQRITDAQTELARERESLQQQLKAAQQAQAEGDGAQGARIAALTETVAALEKKLAAAAKANQRALADAKAAGAASAAQVQALYSDAAALGGKLTENGILLSLAGDELHFASGTATLPKGDLPSLDRIAALLKGKPSLSIRVEGHTDSSGGAETNQRLSQQRAEAVMQALIDHGVDAERITAEGLGAAKPIADNSTEEGRSANRRVDVYVMMRQD
jgi:outer membrane protein OmpA-like peptidoglycan-associated protein